MTLGRTARFVTPIVAVMALTGIVAPTSANAVEVVEFDFSGVITLWDDFNPPFDNPRPLWAATSPAPECTATSGVPLCPQPPGKDVAWVLGTGTGAPDAGVTCKARLSTGATTPCTVTAYGVFHLAASPVPGPYCNSISQGPGHFLVTLGSTTTHLSGTPSPNLPSLPIVPGVPSAHVLPAPQWDLTDESDTTTDRGAGVMAMTKATPNCGLDAPNFDPATQFDVTTSIVWSKL